MDLLPRKRVVVAVEPRLLADTLMRALGTVEGLEITLHLDDGSVQVRGTDCDIALVSGSSAPELRAPVVVRIPTHSSGAGSGTVETAGASRTFHFAGLGDLTDLIIGLARS